MSNANPGGSRNKHGGRVFGASNIKRMIQTQKVDHSRDAHTSIADKPHANTREQQRRLRRQQRKAATNAS